MPEGGERAGLYREESQVPQQTAIVPLMSLMRLLSSWM